MYDFIGTDADNVNMCPSKKVPIYEAEIIINY